MKEQYIVPRPIDDSPEIPSPYRREHDIKSSLLQEPENNLKWIHDLSKESGDDSISKTPDFTLVESNKPCKDHTCVSRNDWSQQRREIVSKLLAQMYEDDGKESTDAFLLEAIRSF